MHFPAFIGLSASGDRKAYAYLPAVLIALLALLVAVGAVAFTRNTSPTGDAEATLPQIGGDTAATLGQITVGNNPALTLPSAPEEFRRITSKTGTYLNLYVNCTTMDLGDNITVTVDVGIDCYSITVGARPDLGQVTVNGKTQTFSSPKITKEENVRSSIHFETLVFVIPKPLNGEATIDISASWVFNGTYGGKELGTITLSETFTVSP